MITIAICDDNTAFSDLLLGRINNLICANANTKDKYEVLCSFDSGLSLLTSTDTSYIDILFLDIDMPDIGGFELAEKLNDSNQNPLIIFVSNYDNMVYSSFNYSPFGFVRKSNLDFDLQQTMERIFSHFNKNDKKITLHTTDGVRNIGTSEIMYVECKKNYYVIKDSSNTVYTCRGPINAIDKELVDPYFYKVHAAYIVNIKYVLSFNAKEGFVEMNDGIKIYISKRKIGDFKKVYLEYLRKGI